LAEPTNAREGLSPYDTATSAGFRFATELVSWVAGPWAAADLTGSGWAAIPALIILMGLPSVFSTTGDKKQVIVATPGPLRLVLEIVLMAVAAIAAWIVWPTWLAVVVSIAVAGAVVSGWLRAKWLLEGAPIPA